MKKIFEFEFNEDNLGPEWFNKSNLGLLLYSKENTSQKLLQFKEITNPSVILAIALLGEDDSEQEKRNH